MADQQVKVVGMWASPYSRRVELALKLKGIPYEYVEEDLSNKSAMLLTSNPVHKKIPVLFHNHKPIAESSVILEYIDETWKNSAYPLLPADPYGRASARFWAKTIDDKLIPTAGKALTMEKGKGKEEAMEEVKSILKLLEGELKGKRFFGGERVGYLDVVATIVAFWMNRFFEAAAGAGFDDDDDELQVFLSEDKFPGLFNWIGELQQVEAVMECCPPKEKHLQLIRARISATTAAPAS